MKVITDKGGTCGELMPLAVLLTMWTMLVRPDRRRAVYRYIRFGEEMN